MIRDGQSRARILGGDSNVVDERYKRGCDRDGLMVLTCVQRPLLFLRGKPGQSIGQEGTRAVSDAEMGIRD